MDDILSFFSWLVVEVLLVSIGRAAVCVVSFGRWRGERIAGNEGRVYGAAGALSFRHQGQRVITRTGLAIAGLASCLLIISAAVVLSGW